MTSDTGDKGKLGAVAIDQGRLNAIVLERFGDRMADPEFQKAMQGGRAGAIITEISTLLDDPAIVAQVMPGATSEQVAEFRQQLANPELMKQAIGHGTAAAQHRQIDKGLADVVKLAIQSPKYRHLFISDLSWRVIPALMLGHCQFMHGKSNQLVAFVSWAKVNAAVLKRMQHPETFRMKEADWNSGSELRIIDVISAVGQEEEIAKEVLARIAGAKSADGASASAVETSDPADAGHFH